MIAEFRFGEWLPDQPDLANPGLIMARNVFPVGPGYDPINEPVASGATVAGGAIGAARIIRPDGSQVLVVGTGTDLYTITGDTVTPSGLALSIPPGGFWSFVPFGRMVWAFAPGVTPHYLPNIATDSLFVPHPGVAPLAATAGRVGDFVVAGNLVDIDTTADPYRIRWSRFNDPAGDWGDDIALQSGAVAMPLEYGPVVAIAGGDTGLILQRYGVHRLDYTGGASVFARREISAGRGCAAAKSVVQVAGVTYFLSDDGFFRTDGSSLQSISSHRVFQWFLGAAKAEAIEKVHGAVDWRTRCIIWSFEGRNAAPGYNQQIIYSWEADRWSCATIGVDWVFDTIKDGMTLEQVSAIYPNIDQMAYSLDSPVFMARGRSLTVIKGGFVCAMSGDNMQATIETGEFQPDPGYRCCVNGVSVLVENTSANSRVTLGGRDTYKGQGLRWTPEQAEGADGMAHPILDARYVRARITIPRGAVWSRATGIQAEYVRTGRA